MPGKFQDQTTPYLHLRLKTRFSAPKPAPGMHVFFNCGCKTPGRGADHDAMRSEQQLSGHHDRGQRMGCGEGLRGAGPAVPSFQPPYPNLINCAGSVGDGCTQLVALCQVASHIGTLLPSQVKQQQIDGILVQDKGSARIEENDIHHNSDHGIFVGYLPHQETPSRV